jgi:hypothetical protein
MVLSNHPLAAALGAAGGALLGPVSVASVIAYAGFAIAFR